MSLLKKLFGNGARKFDGLSAEQDALLEQAQRTVRNYLENGKAFPQFAMALHSDERINSYLPSEEFSTERDALVGILQTLIPLARSGVITAAVLVTPIAPPEGFNESAAMFDLEQRGKPRFGAVLPIRRSASGIEYGEMTFRKMEPKLFAS